MTVWISRRPEAEVAAELAENRDGTGRLTGIRLAVNDNVEVAGMPTFAGWPELAYPADADAAVVAALRAEGAIVVGKTSLDQFATGPLGSRSAGVAVSDSGRLDYISRGTSSRAAVAVSTGETDIAVATDIAVSGRVSADLPAIVGIKPTPGVISTDGVVPGCESYDCVTIFASCLRLADTAMAVLAAQAPKRSWPTDTRLGAPPAPVVAIPDELPYLDGQYRAAFDAAVARLASCGVRVVTVAFAPFLAAAKLLSDGALVSQRWTAIGEFIDVHADATFDPAVRDIVTAATAIPADRLIRDRAETGRLRELAMSSLAGADALLVPTAPAYTDVCNPFDMCAVAVAAGTAGDTRFGVTVLARPFDDAVALDIAALVTGEPSPGTPWPSAAADHVELVVFGAHLLGGPLVHQLTDRGARFAGEIATAPRYRMIALPTTPPKPGVTRVPDGVDGAALTGHRWLLSPAALGQFLAELPAPMQLGKVEFSDGSWRTAFGCDGSVEGADVSHYGSWPAALAAGAVTQT